MPRISCPLLALAACALDATLQVDAAPPTGCVPAAEVCNHADDDCDDLVDDADPDVVGAPTWWADVDLDGWGNPDWSRQACSASEGTVANDDDCADADAMVHPGAVEACNERDDDCDGLVDDDDPDVAGAPTWHRDEDGDGHGDATQSNASCVAPAGWVATSDDCDDADPAVVDCPVPADDGPVAWWRFDEGTGTSAEDSSGHGNHAVLEDLGWTSGVDGYAPDFNGMGDVRGPDIDDYAVSGEITVAAWLRLDATDAQKLAVTQWTDYTDDWGFDLSYYPWPTGLFYFTTSSTGSEATQVSTTTSPLAGEWNHVAGTMAGGKLRMYMNGVLEAEVAAPEGIHNSGWHVLVGWKDDSSATWYRWEGGIDDVRIYDRALTPDEVVAVMTGP